MGRGKPTRGGEEAMERDREVAMLKNKRKKGRKEGAGEKKTDAEGTTAGEVAENPTENGQEKIITGSTEAVPVVSGDQKEKDLKKVEGLLRDLWKNFIDGDINREDIQQLLDDSNTSPEMQE